MGLLPFSLPAQLVLPSVWGQHEISSPPCIAARSPLAPSPTERAPDDAARILVLVEADEGAHLALEGDARFEALPHPLVQKPISHAARAAFSAHDIPYGATTFDVAEAVSRAHPLLRHRVF